MSSLRIGLTGGLAAGKSTVAEWLREAGLEVVDADRLVAELYRPGGAGAAAVAELFGEAFLDAGGGVDHQRLAELIFSDPQARRSLEETIHPLVRREFERLAGRRAGHIVLEAPLLVEAGFAPDFDLVITVEAETGTRLERATARGFDLCQARRRLAAQTDRATRIAAADRVLHNDGTLEALRVQVTDLLHDIEEIANHGT